MSEFATQLSFALSIGTIIAEVAALYLFWRLFQKGRQAEFFSRHALLFGFLVSLGGVIFSLVYSEVVGFEPCTLCWYQRLFLYPQVVIFGVGLLKKDRTALTYNLILSVIGALIAAYHYYGQMFDVNALPCSAAEGISPCAIRFFVEFGYITIPMMSLSTFVLLIALTLLGRQRGVTSLPER